MIKKFLLSVQERYGDCPFAAVSGFGRSGNTRYIAAHGKNVQIAGVVGGSGSAAGMPRHTPVAERNITGVALVVVTLSALFVSFGIAVAGYVGGGDPISEITGIADLGIAAGIFVDVGGVGGAAPEAIDVFFSLGGTGYISGRKVRVKVARV